MKSITKLIVVCMACSAITFTSCEKDEDGKGNNHINTSLVLTENGAEITSWVNNLDYMIEYDNEGYHIQWMSWDENSDRVLYLELGGPVDHYDLTTGAFYDSTTMVDLRYEIGDWRYNVVDDGVLNVTNVNKSGKTISGNFEFKIPEAADGKSYDISGEFTDFPY